MGKRPEYRAAASELGRELAVRRMGLVYGGANVGLMKIIADAMLQEGMRVVGVMPRMLVEKEVAHQGLTEFHTVETMSERKSLIIRLSDAFIAMPGGFGTLDELAEVITCNQLRLSDKPIGLLNTCGYFEPLMRFFDHAVNEGFVREEHRTNLVMEESIQALLDRMAGFQPVSMDKWIRDIHEESK